MIRDMYVRLVLSGMLLAAWTGCVRQEADFFSDGHEIIKIAGDFRFTEGPVWDAGRNRLLFTDIPNNRIHSWSEQDGLDTHREDSGGANGLYFSRDGILVSCDGGARRLTAEYPTGQIHPLATHFQGKRLNSPNDLWIDSRGGIYFTDPRYGKKDDLELDGEFVFYLPPDAGPDALVLVANDLVRPNGIIGTPDGRTLYIADQADDEIWRYEIGADGVPHGKTLFYDKGSDGLALDRRGNLYLTHGSHVLVVSPGGELLAEIEFPEKPANVTFGGRDGKTLFVTARTSVYAVRMKVAGAR